MISHFNFADNARKNAEAARILEEHHNGPVAGYKSKTTKATETRKGASTETPEDVRRRAGDMTGNAGMNGKLVR